MTERDDLIQCCKEMENYIETLQGLFDESDKGSDEIDVLKNRLHELNVLYKNTCIAHDEERRRYLELISSKDVEIKIYSDSYHLIIGSKWWKLTKGLRYVQEVFQKHILHRMTMTETLVEIADLSRYETEQRAEDHADELETPLTLSEEYSQNRNVYDTKVSVIIPTYNGGERFKTVLSALKGQSGIAEIEILVVDSGSTDSTLEICDYMGVDVIKITQDDFSHSYARNLGAEKASGKFLLFMTQDAEPTDSSWLYKLLSVVWDGKIAAASPVETVNGRGDLKYLADSWNHARFLGIDQCDKVTYYSEGMTVEELRKNAQLSDVSCIIRKSLFEQYKYRGDYAEDLQLGLDLIKDGYSLAQLGSVKVKHSHARTPEYIMKRAYIDNKALQRIFSENNNNDVTTEQILSGIVNGYRDTSKLIMRLKDIDGVSDAEEYCNQLRLLLDQETNLIQNDLEDNQAYSDTYFENFIQKVKQMKNGSGISEVSIYEGVRWYVESILIPYLRETKKQLEENDKVEIAETIFKAFACEVGARLAYYGNGKQDELTAWVEKECVGI